MNRNLLGGGDPLIGAAVMILGALIAFLVNKAK